MVTSLDYIAYPSVPEPCTEAVMHGGLQTFPTPCRNTSTLPDMELQAVGGTRAILALSGANYQSHLIRCRSIRHRVSRRSFGGLGDDERYLLNKFCAANELLG
jgi:hypothetical protein